MRAFKYRNWQNIELGWDSILSLNHFFFFLSWKLRQRLMMLIYNLTVNLAIDLLQQKEINVFALHKSLPSKAFAMFISPVILIIIFVCRYEYNECRYFNNFCRYLITKTYPVPLQSNAFHKNCSLSDVLRGNLFDGSGSIQYKMTGFSGEIVVNNISL